jgi:hypothetical protein
MLRASSIVVDITMQLLIYSYMCPHKVLNHHFVQISQQKGSTEMGINVLIYCQGDGEMGIKEKSTRLHGNKKCRNGERTCRKGTNKIKCPSIQHHATDTMDFFFF